MNDPYVNEEERKKKAYSFWHGIFADVPIPFLDLIAGIALPVLCLIFDPGVFRGAPPCGSTLYPEYGLFVYTAVGLGCLALIMRIIPFRLPTHGLGWIAGVFLMGAIVAFMVGVVLLRFSLPALIVGIGLLGFTPFLTAFIYLRHFISAIKQYQRQDPGQPMRWLAVAVVAGMFCAFLIPALAQWQLPELNPSWQFVSTYDTSCANQ